MKPERHHDDRYMRAARTRRRNKAFRNLDELYAKHGFLWADYAKDKWFEPYMHEWTPKALRPKKKKAKHKYVKVIWAWSNMKNSSLDSDLLEHRPAKSILDPQDFCEWLNQHSLTFKELSVILLTIKSAGSQRKAVQKEMVPVQAIDDLWVVIAQMKITAKHSNVIAVVARQWPDETLEEMNARDHAQRELERTQRQLKISEQKSHE